MRMLSGIALSMLLVATLADGQQSSPATPSAPNELKAERVMVYEVGPGVTAPEIIPANGPSIPARKCKQMTSGSVGILFLVDTAGHPRNLSFTLPLGNDLEKLALRIVGAERFKPAMSNGVPVVVAEIAHVDMQACLAETKDHSKEESFTLEARGAPIRTYQSVSNPPADVVLAPDESLWGDRDDNLAADVVPGGPVVAPVQLNHPEPIFTAFANVTGLNGTCTLSLIVDRNGMPRDIRFVRRFDPDLDESAMVAVGKYRFKPATRNGEPVPVRMNVKVDFQLY